MFNIRTCIKSIIILIKSSIKYIASCYLACDTHVNVDHRQRDHIIMTSDEKKIKLLSKYENSL